MSKTTDPRGLIREAYRIDGIGMPECRSIFLDWALNQPGEPDAAIAELLAEYGSAHPDHPMTEVLRQAQAPRPGGGRRGGRRGRVG